MTLEENDIPLSQVQTSHQSSSDIQVTDGGDSSKSLQESSNCIGNNVSVPKLSWFKSMSQIVGLTAVWQQSKVEGSPRGEKTVNSTKTNNSLVHSEFNFFLSDKLCRVILMKIFLLHFR